MFIGFVYMLILYSVERADINLNAESGTGDHGKMLGKNKSELTTHKNNFYGYTQIHTSLRQGTSKSIKSKIMNKIIFVFQADTFHILKTLKKAKLEQDKSLKLDRPENM